MKPDHFGLRLPHKRLGDPRPSSGHRAHTYGNQETYRAGLAAHPYQLEKRGRSEGYSGGSVWRTADEVWAYIDQADLPWVAACYELDLPVPYDECVELHSDVPWDDLLVNARIIREVPKLRATSVGKIELDGAMLQSAVVDGRHVLCLDDVWTVLQVYPPRREGLDVAKFVRDEQLTPFFSSYWSSTLDYRLPSGEIARGIDVRTLADICSAYRSALRRGVLLKNQRPIALRRIRILQKLS